VLVVEVVVDLHLADLLKQAVAQVVVYHTEITYQ
jgi:hypothetical protein